LVKGLRVSPLLQTHGLRPDKRAANGARGFVGLLMIAMSSFALTIPGRLNRIVNAVVPASRVRGMMAKMFKKTLAKPQPQVKPQTKPRATIF
jgi:hypothetical protein